MKFKEINIKNRRATFDYAIGDTFTAGIVLTGTEIKSIREARHRWSTRSAMSTTARCGSRTCISPNISTAPTTTTSTAATASCCSTARRYANCRRRQGAGFTIVPLRLFINDRGLAKLVIGVGRGKKEYDKRQSIKEREDKRSMARLFQK